jgi:hypothetical protein
LEERCGRSRWNVYNVIRGIYYYHYLTTNQIVLYSALFKYNLHQSMSEK